MIWIGYPVFRTLSFCTQVWVSSYTSRWSILTWFVSFPIIWNNSSASMWTDVICCVRQGSRIEQVLKIQAKFSCVYLKHDCLAQGKFDIFIGKVNNNSLCKWDVISTIVINGNSQPYQLGSYADVIIKELLNKATTNILSGMPRTQVLPLGMGGLGWVTG